MNWLKELREYHKMTQQELAYATDLNVFTIQNIEQGKRTGSIEVMKALLCFFNSDNTSFDSEELIAELKEDIEEFGENTILYAMFEIIDYHLFLTNYDFIEKEKPLTKKEKSQYCVIAKYKAKDILHILEVQDDIFDNEY